MAGLLLECTFLVSWQPQACRPTWLAALNSASLPAGVRSPLGTDFPTSSAGVKKSPSLCSKTIFYFHISRTRGLAFHCPDRIPCLGWDKTNVIVGCQFPQEVVTTISPGRIDSSTHECKEIKPSCDCP